MATPGFLKIKVFWNKGYEVIHVNDVDNRISSRDWNCIVNAVMWQKFSDSSVSIRVVLITSILWGCDPKNNFFEEWSWFKFNNFDSDYRYGFEILQQCGKRSQKVS